MRGILVCDKHCARNCPFSRLKVDSIYFDSKNNLLTCWVLEDAPSEDMEKGNKITFGYHKFKQTDVYCI